MRVLSILCGLLMTLVGCSNNVQSFIVAPEVFWTPSNKLTGMTFALTVQDNRPSNATLIMRDGDQVRSYPATNNLVGQLNTTLSDTFKKQGAQVQVSDPVAMIIQINQLEANAEINLANHTVRNSVALTLMIEKGTGSFNKSYSANSSFTQPLKLDTAMAERELRILTEQVLGNMLNDASWQDFLRN